RSARTTVEAWTTSRPHSPWRRGHCRPFARRCPRRVAAAGAPHCDATRRTRALVFRHLRAPAMPPPSPEPAGHCIRIHCRRHSARRCGARAIWNSARHGTFEAPVAMQATKDWWRGAVIYQIYPRSFMDTNGDGVGDLPGIAERLDYVASLGVDAIWVSPFFRSPMADFGYDISDQRDVDPLFGTLDDFDRLLEKAHRLGLKVMIDQVFSHTSDQHPWFQESRRSRDNPRADWYVWADAKDDGTPPNNWMSLFGGVAWRWEPRRGQ